MVPERQWFGHQKLRDERVRAGLTQTEIANRIGVTHSTYNRIERGLAIPSWQTVVMISEVLGVSLDVFWCPPPVDPDTLNERIRRK